MKTKEVRRAGLAIAAQGLAEQLTGKPAGKIHRGASSMSKEPDKPEAKPAVKPVAISMADRVRMARENIAAGGASLSKMVDDAVQVARDVENVQFFMDAMAGVDNAATNLRLFNSNSGERWEDLPLKRVEAEVRQWAQNGNEMAKKLIDLLDALKGEVSALEILWTTYAKVVRPANAIRGYNELKAFLVRLEKDRLADRLDPKDLRSVPKNAVVVRLGNGEKIAYLPARVNKFPVPESEKGWPWVKKAEQRTVEKILDKMKESDTGLTIAKIRGGCNGGTIFLRAGDLKGALIEARICKGLRIRILDAFGSDIATPTNWVSAEIRRDQWPDDDLYRAFMAWTKAE